jgi:magnesium chelatase family protein
VARYQSRLSGPILDRIDLKVRLSPLSGEERFIYASGDSSKAIRSRVEVARAVQKARFKGTPISANAWIPGGHVNEYCELHPSARRAMEEVSTSVPGLTMRGFDQLLKLGRTVADLNGSALIYKKHIEEAADLSGHEDVAEVLAKYHDVGNCPGCGMKADAGDRFCRRCGLGLIEVER